MASSRMLRSRDVFIIFFIAYTGIDIYMAESSVVNRRFTGLRRHGLKLRTEHVDQQIVSIDRIPCAKECVQRSNCRTISWNRQKKTCFLSHTDVTNGKTANNALDVDVNWNTMSMMEYTVFSLDISHGVSISYADAVNLCKEQSTVIAGAADLLYSHSLGFEYYKCCWLSDGSIGYVIQSRATVQYCTPHSNPWVVCVLN